MGLWSNIKGIFSGRRKGRGDDGAPTEVAYEIQSDETSRFGTVTNRINREHWRNATLDSINNDLLQRLPSLQARSAHEFSTNPDFEGVCNTFKDDVVGRNGPMLQVMSNNDDFNNAVEVATREVFEDPDPSHRYGGVEDMRTWVHGLLNAGSYYNVQANTRRRGSRMTFGWRSIHARRLVTPAQFSGDPNVAFGCRYEESTGAPREYYIQKPNVVGGAQVLTGDFDTVSAEAVQHVYIPVEAEQLTGFPLMSSTLDTSADMVDLRAFVKESIKNAAANAPYIQSAQPDKITDPDPIPPGGLRYEPGEIGFVPAGNVIATVPATQPAATFLDFYHELAAQLGRPIHMPLLVVLLSAVDSNFSVAQYEGTVYTDAVASVQGVIERRSLIPFVRFGIIPEVVFRQRVPVPDVFELVWTWNVPAHANIEKFVKAIRMMIEDGTISQAQASALLGFDWEKVVQSREKCARILEEKGLPPAPANVGGNAAQDEPENENESLNGGRVSASRFSIA